MKKSYVLKLTNTFIINGADTANKLAVHFYDITEVASNLVVYELVNENQFTEDFRRFRFDLLINGKNYKVNNVNITDLKGTVAEDKIKPEYATMIFKTVMSAVSNRNLTRDNLIPRYLLDKIVSFEKARIN